MSSPCEVTLGMAMHRVWAGLAKPEPNLSKNLAASNPTQPKAGLLSKKNQTHPFRHMILRGYLKDIYILYWGQVKWAKFA